MDMQLQELHRAQQEVTTVSPVDTTDKSGWDRKKSLNLNSKIQDFLKMTPTFFGVKVTVPVCLKRPKLPSILSKALPFVLALSFAAVSQFL